MAQRKSIGGMAGGAFGASYAPNVATPLGNFPGAPPTDWRRTRREKGQMATSDRQQRDASLDAIKKLRRVLHVLQQSAAHETAEMHDKARYTRAERQEIRREKHAEYGREYFAVPELSAYPLTKRGRPNRERFLAAWRYIHQRRNAGKLGDRDAERAEQRMRAFAKKHFPDLALEDAQKARTVEELLRGMDAHPGDEALKVIYRHAPVTDAIGDVHRYLEETSNTRDHDTLLHRAHLLEVLDRLVELADRSGALS